MGIIADTIEQLREAIFDHERKYYIKPTAVFISVERFHSLYKPMPAVISTEDVINYCSFRGVKIIPVVRFSGDQVYVMDEPMYRLFLELYASALATQEDLEEKLTIEVQDARTKRIIEKKSAKVSLFTFMIGEKKYCNVYNLETI